jgi:hypothetical protein
MTYENEALGQIMPGCPIFTQDGNHIGEVKEIRGRYFKVDAPMRPDYWLSRNAVATSRSRPRTSRPRTPRSSR